MACMVIALFCAALISTNSASSADSSDTKIRGQVTIKGSNASPPVTLVEIFKRGTRTKVAEGKTEGPRGLYEISSRIDPGTYDFSATPTAPYKKTSVTREIASGPNSVDLMVEHPVSSSVRGMARSESGSAVAQAKVCVYAPGNNDFEIGCTSTDQFGAFDFALAPDAYRFAVKSKNAEGVERLAFVVQEVKVTSNKPLAFDLKLDWRGPELTVIGTTPDFGPLPLKLNENLLRGPERSISGKITYDGGPVPGVAVTITDSKGQTQTKTTGEDGTFVFLNLEPGTYAVKGVPPSALTEFTAQEVEVDADTPASLSVQLRPAGSGEVAQVRVHDASGRNLRGLYDEKVATLYSSDMLLGVITSRANIAGSSTLSASIQEFQSVLGRFSADHSRSSGGILNLVDKSGTNDHHGEVFGYGRPKGTVRELRNFPFTRAPLNDFSDLDAGGNIGGPIVRDKLWYYISFNPQHRSNYYLTQSFHRPVSHDQFAPFYAGRIDWHINSRNTFAFTTTGDFTTVKGFLATSALNNVNGFGDDPAAFEGRQETGGHAYSFRLVSTITNNFLAEFSGGLSRQRDNTIPQSSERSRVTDNFAVFKGDSVLTPIQSGVHFGEQTGFVDYVDGRGGSLQRNFVRGPGFGLFSTQARDRYEFSARMHQVLGRGHNLKWGFEWNQHRNDIDLRPTGPSLTYGFTPGAVNADGTPLRNTNGDSNITNGSLITNHWLVCTVRGAVINCPSAAAVARVQAIPGVQLTALGLTLNPNPTAITTAEAFNSPFLVRGATRVRDFQLTGETHTNVESFYASDEWNIASTLKLTLGVRWDYQQAYGAQDRSYFKFNNFIDNAAPRLGFTWDFTGTGRGKLYGNYAKYIEAPTPFDVNLRASGPDIQTDKHFNVDRLNAPPGSLIVPGISTGATNLGAGAAPPDPGLRPQSVREFVLGAEFEVGGAIVIGAQGIYQAMNNVIEDGSFNDGDTYFILNPGRLGPGTFETAACAGDVATGRAPQCLGRAQRFYRAVEINARRRLKNNFLFTTAYTYSSSIGNLSNLVQTDEGQPNFSISPLFDSQSLLVNTYGRLPNDRPHVFLFSGLYETPFKLTIAGIFSAKSGVAFNALVPHPIFGNNEGFLVPRGTAIVPSVSPTQPGFPNVVESIGNHRAPTTMNLDLGAHYTFRFGERVRLRLNGDWLNVFNRQRAFTLDQTFTVNSGVPGIPSVANPFYGSALGIQTPSAFRFGAKLTF